DAAPGAVGAARVGGGRRPRAARHRSHAGRRRPRTGLTRYASPKLAAYAALSAVGLRTGLVLPGPGPVALTPPFLPAPAGGRAPPTRRRLSVAVGLDESRALEGDEVGAHVVVESSTPVDRLDLYLALPDGVELSEGKNPVGLRLAAGERRELEFTIRAER